MTVILIANMTCGGCAKGVARTLEEVVPGKVPQFDLAARHVSIDAEPGPVLHALRDGGWEATLVLPA